MLTFIEKLLSEFRICFSRTKTYNWFLVIISALLTRYDSLGVTSFIRALSLNHRLYCELPEILTLVLKNGLFILYNGKFYSISVELINSRICYSKYRKNLEKTLFVSSRVTFTGSSHI